MLVVRQGIRGAILLLLCGCVRRPAATTPTPSSLPDVDRAVLAAVADSLAAHFPDSSSVCVGIMGGSNDPSTPDSLLLGMLRSRYQHLPWRQCPHTYASMVAHVDSQGRPVDPPRPRGYVDPYYLWLGRPAYEHRQAAWVYSRLFQGTEGSEHLCRAEILDGRVSVHYCRTLARWIS